MSNGSNYSVLLEHSHVVLRDPPAPNIIEKEEEERKYLSYSFGCTKRKWVCTAGGLVRNPYKYGE